MAYLGREIQYGSFAKQTLTANSSTTVFTLSNGVADANNLLVSIGGIIQEPNVAYTAIGTVLTFASAPVTDDPIFVTFLGMESASAGAGRSDVTFQKGTGNGSATPLTLSTSVVNPDSIRVSLNGVVQKPWTDFTASGTTLTFTTAPDATNEILVYYVGKEASLDEVATGSVTPAKLTSSGTLPAWDGSNISNISVIPYSKLNDLNHNLALIGFRRSTDHGTSSLDLPNGFIDQFEDQTNVNDDNSVYEVYDATGDYYSNNGDVTTTPSSSSDWTGTGGATFSSGEVQFTGPNSALYSTAQLTGDFEFTSTASTAAASRGHWAGVFPVSEVGTFGAGHENGHMESMTNSYFGAWETRALSTEGIMKGGNSVRALTLNHLGTGGNADVFKIKRVGSTITFYKNGTLVHTETSAPTAAMYACVGGGGGGGASNYSYYTSVSWTTDGTPTNMTLVSESDTAAASTDKAYVTLFNQPVDSVTLNTDIMAWASRSSKTVTATNATNLLTANGHGLSNNDRVILTTSASDLPNGLTETAYYVVSSTTNTFQVAATSGGAAITFSDNGTGTHTVHAVTQATLADKGDYGTGKATLAGTADISGQPTGTDMRLIVQTKNTKETKLHGMALQYS